MTADTLIFRLMHAACILKGMCGNEPDNRDPAMARDWMVETPTDLKLT